MSLKNTLVPFGAYRGARFIEACASWVDASPSFQRLQREAFSLVYGRNATDEEKNIISGQLMGFFRSSIGTEESTNTWLRRLLVELIEPWMLICRNVHQEWQLCSTLISRTNPEQGLDIPLKIFAGRVDGSGRMTLSTLHSAKGREFKAVIMFGVNKNGIPSKRDLQSNKALREARRLFYVGVTRPKQYLYLVFGKNEQSPWVNDLYKRIN